MLTCANSLKAKASGPSEHLCLSVRSDEMKDKKIKEGGVRKITPRGQMKPLCVSRGVQIGQVRLNISIDKVITC